MIYVLRHVIRVRNHIAASVDEKGVRREVPNEHISFVTYIGTLMLKEWQDSSLTYDVQATTSHHVLNKFIMHLIK